MNRELSRRDFAAATAMGLVGGALTLAKPTVPDAQAAAAPTTIKRVNRGGIVYECITVDRWNLTKIQGRTFNPTKFQQHRETMSAQSGRGYAALINSDSWAATDHKSRWASTTVPMRPVGLQIMNGRVYQNFGAMRSEMAQSDREAIVFLKSGKLVPARSSSRITSAQWRARGALWSAGYGPTLIEGGRINPTLTKPVWSDFSKVSARTCLGQRADGRLVIVVVRGINQKYGANAAQCADIMKREGCIVASLLDGSGSSQIWWNNRYVHPSSDGSGVRATAGGFLAIRGRVPAFK